MNIKAHELTQNVPMALPLLGVRECKKHKENLGFFGGSPSSLVLLPRGEGERCWTFGFCENEPGKCYRGKLQTLTHHESPQR